MANTTSDDGHTVEGRLGRIFEGRASLSPVASQSSALGTLRVTPVPGGDVRPLAIAQERFWFLHRLDPASPADNVAVALRLDGPLHLGHYQHAWDRIFQRHDVLRSTFPTRDGIASQRVSPAVPVNIQVHDLSDLPQTLAEQTARERAAAVADLPFELERGPVHRLVLYRLPGDAYIALYVFHHIVCDLWSIGVLSHELTTLYTALLQGREPELRPLRFQYADYAVRHREWLTGPALESAIAYWRRQLAGVSFAELPVDHPKGARPGTGATGVVDLPAGLMRDLRTMAGRLGATPFMVLTAAFSYLLSRYTGQTDVVIGTPIANRTSLELKGIVGTFVNTLVFRTETAGAATFRDLLARTRNTALSAFEHQHVSFHRLVNELKPERAHSRAHLFQVLFNVQNAPVRLPSLPDVTVSSFTLPRRSAQFDLAVSVDTDVLHQIGYAYDSSLFDASTIERLVARYLALVRAVVGDPDLDLDSFDLLLPQERALILHSWNDTRESRDGETVVDAIERQARATPDRIAVEGGESTRTYAQLDAQATRMARHLAAAGVGRGSLVGVCMPRTADLLVALIAVLKTGAAYLPLDASYPKDRLAYTLKDSGASVVISNPSLTDRLPHDLPVVTLTDGTADSTAWLPARPSGEDLAYVIYTSGSTGRPKGVEVSHGALQNLLLSMRERPGIVAEDRLLAVTTLSFDISALELFLPLLAGATVVLASRDDGLDPRRLARLIDEREITVMQATPTTWRMLTDDGWTGRPDLAILSGGESLSRDLAERLLGCGRSVWNLYGPTETTIWSTVDQVTAGVGPVSVGRPIANTQVYVIDDRGRLLPPGLPGELAIGGVGLARGYRGRSDLTAERFVPDTFGARKGARLYRTGDRARFVAEGRIELLGRADGQLKIRGFRVELGEVEACLAGLPGVRSAAVVARTDAQHAVQLVGFVVPDGSFPVTQHSLREGLSRTLPGYMVPSQIGLLSALPTTLNGKVDRSALAQAPLETRPLPEALLHTTDTETRLLAIWREELGQQSIGIDEDFFDLGGHSLLAVRLASRVEREFGRTIEVATVLSSRTVRQLGAEVDRQHGGAGPS